MKPASAVAPDFGRQFRPAGERPADPRDMHFGAFSIADLDAEFEQEQKSGTLHDAMATSTTKREKRMKEIEKKFMTVMRMDMLQKPSYADQLPYHQYVFKLVLYKRFQFFFFALVAFYSLIMGLELQFDDKKYEDQWFRLNAACAFFFTLECMLKMYSFGHHYFMVPWFLLEFFTTGAYVVALGLTYKGMDEVYAKTFVACKVSRILLMAKLFSMRTEFQVIVLGFTRSVMSLWGIAFVIVIVCYGCTLFCFSVIGKADYSDQPYFDHNLYFGSIARTMMTLFSMIIVDEWSLYARPVYEEQSAVVLFFFVFTVMLTLGLLNVVTGMVVETVSNVAEDHASVLKVTAQNVQKRHLKKIINRIFKEQDGVALTEEDFKHLDNKTELTDMITTIDFPTSFTLQDLFILLDYPGHRSIMKEQFIDGVMNFIHGDLFQLDCQVLLSINKVYRDIIAVRKELRVMHDRVQHDLHRDDDVGFRDGTLADQCAHLGEFSAQGLADEFAKEQAETKESVCLTLLPKHYRMKKKTGLDVMMEDAATLKRPEYVKRWPGALPLNNLVHSKRFAMLYFVLVAAFSVMMGVEMEWTSEYYKQRWFYMNGWFTFMFSIEAFLKLYVYGHNYFRVPWYVLEFATTWGGMMVLGIQYTGMAESYSKMFTCLKLSRVLLLGKLFNLRKEFEIIITGFTKSLMNLWGILFVLLVINYGCTLFAYSVIGQTPYPGHEADHALYWGSIPKTMITLFSMMVKDGWSAYSRPVFEVQPPVVLFFFVYSVFLTMGLLNVVTGMVVDTVNTVKMNANKRDMDKLQEAQRVKLAKVVSLVFHNSAHQITEDEFVRHSSRGELAELLEIVDFPHHFTLRDFFTILDSTGHKTLYKSQFVDGLVNLINSNVFHRECQILLAVHKLRRGLVDLRKELVAVHHRVRDAAAEAAKWRAVEVAKAKPPEETEEERLTKMTKAYLSGEIRSLSKDARSKPKRGDHWEQLRATLHDAAMEHCLDELRVAWQVLEAKYKIGNPAYDAHGFMPTPTPPGTTIAEAQETWYVWHKLYTAVINESVHELREALDNAKLMGVTEKSSAILFTFCDALARQQQIQGFSPREVVQALDTGDWMRALDLVVEISLARGADKSMMLSALSRFCTDSSSQQPKQQQTDVVASNVAFSTGVAGAAKMDFSGLDGASAISMSAMMKPDVIMDDMRGRLVEVLHKEASEHSARELSKAWEELDRAYRSADLAGKEKGGFGPGYSPFSKQEEYFFIRNHINNGVSQENLLELRRALAHAMSFGIDLRDVELEVAYRDALARHHQGDGFNSEYVCRALERGDWWTALDDILGASFARGADRHMLLKMIAKVCSPTVTFGSPRTMEKGRKRNGLETSGLSFAERMNRSGLNLATPRGQMAGRAAPEPLGFGRANGMEEERSYKDYTSASI